MSNKPGVYMPTPEGFAEAASGMSLKEACRHWKVGETLMRRWRKESGLARFNPNAFRVIPSDFMERAPDMSLKAMCRRWNCGKAVARRWCKEAGIVIRTTLTPEQIQHLTDTMTQEAAADQVGVTVVTFRKMQREAGIAIPKSRVEARRAVMLRNRPEPMKKVAPARPPIYNAAAQYAKDWLQRQEPIWRCREDGAYDFTGSYFRFRGRVWDAASLVEKARDMGWSETRAWSVAA